MLRLWLIHPESDCIWVGDTDYKTDGLVEVLGAATEGTSDELFRVLTSDLDWPEREARQAVKLFKEREKEAHMTDEPERTPCPECGKEVTWTQAGKPRAHKCEPKQGQPEQTGGVTVDRVVAKYIETRDEIDQLKKRLDDAIADLKALQQKRETWLLNKMNELGVESLRSAHGTCFTDKKTSATVADRETFFDWVKREDRFEFLESRVSKTAVKQLLDDGQLLPPGVNYTEIKDVKIRRK